MFTGHVYTVYMLWGTCRRKGILSTYESARQWGFRGLAVHVLGKHFVGKRKPAGAGGYIRGDILRYVLRDEFGDIAITTVAEETLPSTDDFIL